jgi:MarR family transcriptional regulator, organic hydroperoxide resistance regulator
MVSATPHDGHDADLGVLLVSASARLNRLYGRVLGQLDTSLTFRQHRLLRRVGEGHTSLAALAAFGNLTLPTVSESVEGLVRRGLLNRRENPRNRRQTVLSLTAAGREAKVAGDAALASVNDRLLRVLSDERREALRESLTLLYGAATEVFREPDATAPEVSAPAPVTQN